jgi:hypothetical protein
LGEINFFSLRKGTKKADSPEHDEKGSKPNDKASKSKFSIDLHPKPEEKDTGDGKKGDFASGWLSSKQKAEAVSPNKEKERKEVKKAETAATFERVAPSPLASDAKVRSLIEIVSHQQDHAVYPHINYEANKITFPLLSQIGESEDNIAFLEKLSAEGMAVFEKQIFERLIICPDHPDSYAISLRLYCPKCKSPDIEKLHLVEHKSCGYIGEKTEFDVAGSSPGLKCPMCRNAIRDASKELKIPGMWYECYGCKSKFDNPTMKMHCRRFNHDFNLNQAESIVVPCFKLMKEVSSTNIKALPLIALIKRLLAAKGFSVEENAQIKGASGVPHTANLFGRMPDTNKTVLIDIRSSEASADDTEVVSLFVKVVDVAPSFAIFVAIPSISDKARAMSAAYSNISIVTGRDFDEIVKLVDEALAKHMATPQEKKI